MGIRDLSLLFLQLSVESIIVFKIKRLNKRISHQSLVRERKGEIFNNIIIVM